MAGTTTLPSPGEGLLIGRNMDCAIKDLAVHDAVLTPGELNFLHDREQPHNFNRIVITNAPAAVWVNGTRLNRDKPGELDTSKFTRYLKPGSNVVAFEFEASQRNRFGRNILEEDVMTGIWIRGHALSVADSPFDRGWETVSTDRENVGSWLLAAYNAQINRQFAFIDDQRDAGKDPGAYRQPAWRPDAYDRPWLAALDQLDWQPVTWRESGDDGLEKPRLSPGDGLRLLRFRFVLDEDGVPRPFDPAGDRMHK
ncbi:MAG: hypothetical protein ACO398_09860 [Kiritimatiellia bacterium]